MRQRTGLWLSTVINYMLGHCTNVFAWLCSNRLHSACCPQPEGTHAQTFGMIDIWAYALPPHPKFACMTCLSRIISPPFSHRYALSKRQTSNIMVNINVHCLMMAIAEHEAPQLILHQPIAVYRWVLQSMVCRRCCPPTTTSPMCCVTAS